MIVIDVETTGVDPKKCSIVSIGAVDFENPSNTFYGECKIDKNSEVTDKALEVNGFTMEQITDRSKPSVAELLKMFFDWIKKIKNTTIACHNMWFDYSFIKEASEKFSLQLPFFYRCVDLHSLAYSFFMKNNLEIPIKNSSSHLTSEIIFNYVGLGSEPNPHNALTGAKMAAESISRLIHGKILLEEFKSCKIPKDLTAHL